jgi:DNA-binding NarL/FixJ family response regulator
VAARSAICHEVLMRGAKTRVLVVDDDDIVRDALTAVLDAQADISVVGAAADADEAIELIGRHRPEIVILDVSLAPVGGVTLTEQLSRAHPLLRVIVISEPGDEPVVKALFGAGARGCVLKRRAPSELPKAIHAVAAGRRYVDGVVARALLAADHRCEPAAELAEPMTRQEERVLRLLARLRTHEEIAERLAISVEEAIHLKSAAMRKNRLSSRAQVLDYARDRGWLRKLGQEPR